MAEPTLTPGAIEAALKAWKEVPYGRSPGNWAENFAPTLVRALAAAEARVESLTAERDALESDAGDYNELEVERDQLRQTLFAAQQAVLTEGMARNAAESANRRLREALEVGDEAVSAMHDCYKFIQSQEGLGAFHAAAWKTHDILRRALAASGLPPQHQVESTPVPPDSFGMGSGESPHGAAVPHPSPGPQHEEVMPHAIRWGPPAGRDAVTGAAHPSNAEKPSGDRT